ncbi:hypothetical protein ACLOJK_008468 [Asimina triloba]
MASAGWDGRQVRRGRDGEIAYEAASLPLSLPPSSSPSLSPSLPPSFFISLPLEAAATSISSSSSAAHSRRVRLSRSAGCSSSDRARHSRPAHLHQVCLPSSLPLFYFPYLPHLFPVSPALSIPLSPSSLPRLSRLPPSSLCLPHIRLPKSATFDVNIYPSIMVFSFMMDTGVCILHREGDQSDAGSEMNLNIGQELRYHFLGTDQSQDVLCWKDPENPKWTFDADITDDGKYLILYIGDGCDATNKFYYCDLFTLPGGLEAHYEVVANDDSVFTFRTNKDAPRYKLVRADLREPSLWTDVIQEAEKDVLESAHVVNGNQLLVRYLSDCKSVVQLRDLTSGQLLQHIPLNIGNVSRITDRRKDHEVFINFTSFLTPGIIYKCNLASGVPEVKVFCEILVPGFDRTEFQVNQVFVPSKDGTKIALFIVSKKDIILDNSHPCLLYGYGGFGINITPSFRVSRIVLMRHLGIIFSIANIHGGGEYGAEWHKAGSLLNKQKAFDDFISVGEYLISAG